MRMRRGLAALCWARFRPRFLPWLGVLPLFSFLVCWFCFFVPVRNFLAWSLEASGWVALRGGGFGRCRLL